MKKYNEIELNNKEAEFLFDLEYILNKKIPPLPPTSLEKFGFRYEDNNITHLLLSRNKLTSLPSSIANLENLRLLHVHTNPMRALPVEILNIETLQSFSIGETHIQNFPDWLGDFPNLTDIYLFGLELEEIPSFCETLPLTRLSIYNNKISNIPSWIGRLIKLREFSIANNQISEIPISLCRLKKLEELTIFGNRLGSIPRCITKLTQLQRLILNNNRISELPPTMGNLCNLSVLTLNSNRFQSIPESFVELKSIKTFWVHENPDLRISAKIKDWLIHQKSLGSNIRF